MNNEDALALWGGVESMCNQTYPPDLNEAIRNDHLFFSLQATYVNIGQKQEILNTGNPCHGGK
jgi:hypothetical protein